VYFDDGSKSSLGLYCILRDGWKKLRTVLKALGPALSLYTSSFYRKCKFVLVSLARGPLRREAQLEEISEISLKPALTTG